MSSKIEQMIDQIEDFIDSCRYQTFSKTNIIVDKDEMDALLEELRAKTPDEIRHYQRIIANKEAILDDAKRKAEEMSSAKRSDSIWKECSRISRRARSAPATT